jgi:hypothetical protein
MFIEDPIGNSMAMFNFTVALEKGATFILNLWVCVADGAGCSRASGRWDEAWMAPGARRLGAGSEGSGDVASGEWRSAGAGLGGEGRELEGASVEQMDLGEVGAGAGINLGEMR